ncbi:ABC transporter permease [Kallotenue papyrolyticum]|uniref:ABC transporter permease n=1 Tax=Kallotenue papyrolyticum TaxID=1325125 RepID=UPI0004924DDB|nr:ABC transporter permease [Kallotenue papyrolyticum]
MSARATWQLFLGEVKLFLREPFALFFTLAFPVILLLLFGSVYGSLPVENGYRFIDVYVPSLFAMVLANLGLMNIPITLADYREQGIFKRYQVTPLPAWALLLIQILVNSAMFLVSAALVLVVARLLFDLRFGGNLLFILVALLISMAALFAGGFAIGGLTPGVRTAQTAGSAIFFVMFFSSGAAIPRGEFPEWLRRITDYVPLTHVVDTLSGLWINEPIGKYWLSLLMLALIAVAAGVIASRTFRWQAG